MRDYSEQVYLEHWQAVRARNPEADPEAQVDAFLEGALAHADLNSHQPDEWEDLRRRLRDSDTTAAEQSETRHQ